ncbi:MULTISPECIES: ABC transporter ATP-binding protein [Methanoculleus]|uniref:ABC transporter-related protein n=2 Tax=Methanoculleus TaxID=45989 RepID=A3CVE0_METMJ|nr:MULTISPECIES: ABC transporter ATP-binding protein [Methanoculleus]ABN57340.1 ABC transporter-related protein [Methanoculleus marisnigri JR1]MCC7555413.1 ABC transporter ATP-binding protein [Methanoculleus marisnigri]UYU18749.1 ABC transporter ATP-binding protein [Methanoculleus submarinus]
MIRCDHLTKIYNSIAAVDDLCLEIPAGEVFGLLGPNGAGKSTTILMLVGLIQPTSGACSIDGTEVAAHPIEVKKKIGYMPEDVGFYPDRTAEENLDYAARFYGLSEAERKRRVDDLLALVGLDGVGTKVGGYSKGMRQRLGLARALVNEPAVVILDEPTANLDPRGVLDYRRIVRSLADRGTTVLVSSHILSEVSKVCTSVGILARGKLIASGDREMLSRAAMQDRVTIDVETVTPMPRLTNPEILSAEYSQDTCSARIVAKHDISGFIAETLYAEGILPRRLAVEMPDMEDILLSYYAEGTA